MSLLKQKQTSWIKDVIKRFSENNTITVEQGLYGNKEYNQRVYWIHKQGIRTNSFFWAIEIESLEKEFNKHKVT